MNIAVPENPNCISPPVVERTRRAFFFRRLKFGALVLSSWFVLSWKALAVLQLNGLTILELGIFALFVILSLPLVLSFWTAILGAIVQFFGGDPLELTRRSSTLGKTEESLTLTAVIVPVYNEEPGRVMAGLKATYQSLERTGRLSAFEFFILSDTTDPDVWVREELAFVELRKQVSDPGRVFYRNRRHNVERKTGNIADFCASWGGRYKYMIVFDADSIMAGESLVRLVSLMEEHPEMGIIQAPPLPVNRTSLFGRMQQFAMHLYSQVFISGLNYWQGGAGNYWGHNAIIRIEPFIRHCRLPALPGKPPLGGSILSHDFVEAAFMRRAGWRVCLASELKGSYEEIPSSLLGYAARDRRWCQGNLQHGKLLFAPGFHFISRVQIWMGMMGYVASPLWLMLLALTTAQGIWDALVPHSYFATTPSLFPHWPVSITRPALAMFGVVMGLLLLPKALGVLIQLLRPERLRNFGGLVKVLGSALLELVISTLLAPNLALLHSRFVISILMGSTAKWEAQDRGDSGTPWREAVQRHWSATALGIAWTALLAFTTPNLLWWFSPILLGYLLAIPVSVWTSRTGAGLWFLQRGLFVIPEELNPTDVIRQLQSELARSTDGTRHQSEDPLGRVLADPDFCELHLAMLPHPVEPEDPLKRHERDGLVLKYLQCGPDALTSAEKRELLLQPGAIQALRDPSARAA